jgi:hypothetical protein
VEPTDRCYERTVGHRVTIETELKNAVLVDVALRAAGFAFTREKEAFVIVADDVTATLDTRTGRLTSEDVEMPRKFGLLRQLYTEAKYHAECERQGITFEARTIDKDGNVVLLCSMN